MSAPRRIGRPNRLAGAALGAVALLLAVLAVLVLIAPTATDPAPTTDGTGRAGVGNAAPPPTAAGAFSDLEAEVVTLANRARSQGGLGALQVTSDLTDVARTHAVRMADDDHLHHNPTLTDEVSGWRIVGENVGRGPSVEALHRALMDSPSHRDNILDDRYAQIGVGIEVRDGTVWVTQVFRTPTDAAAGSGTG